MNKLSTDRLYDRGEILSVMLSAGQFAHASQEAMEGVLDDLWNPEVRWVDEQRGAAMMDHWGAVPVVLVAAKRAGFITKECFTVSTLHHMAKCVGVVCCLCLEIDGEDTHRGASVVPSGMMDFICPTALGIESRFDGYSVERLIDGLAQPLCPKCKRALGGRFWKQFQHKIPHELPEIEYLDALSYLANFHGFRQRVERNAGNVSLLRFDPRKPL